MLVFFQAITCIIFLTDATLLKGQKSRWHRSSLGRKTNDTEAGTAIARALIGGGGVNIHTFVLCPTNRVMPDF